MVRVPDRRAGRASVAALARYRPGQRSRLIYRVHHYRRRKGEAAGFTWRDHQELKKIQYRPHLIDGCLAETNLVLKSS
ncbi:hypothetical protein J2S55_007710 [Streptosporangium brasiliense]|uniref:Transposase n=1 Tax=Streptosporangium brasiliense TaxID=47480 RepID=A0ABT9RI94_9ACTN|nr:hypothetical protein [Streptosporangium brasiliense]MDP9868444.1 hypothetical protein [Streptosporangium brasiliense]